MPDQNKLDALSRSGFSIQAACCICKHATFNGGSAWGTCSQILYQHAKHTGSARAASIHAAGHCAKFEMDLAHQEDLARSGFDRFISAASA